MSFWSKIFEKFLPEKKVHIVARGGKPALESLAKQIIDKDISNTIVAMDADYDELLNDKIKDPRVLYTYGYSWENDVHGLQNAFEVFKVIGHRRTISNEIKEHLKNRISELERQLTWPVRADFLALQAKASIFNRNTPGRYIECCKKTGASKINRREIVKSCKRVNGKTKPRTPYVTANFKDISRYCVGHLYSFGVASIIAATIRAFVSKRAVPTAGHVRDIGLHTFSSIILGKSRNPSSKHYKQMCSKIPGVN